jgi:hypothetical protein
MKVWKLIPGEPVEELEVNGDPMRFAREVINATMDVTRVRYLGKLRPMAVDDEGMCKELPVNEEATKAYHANCKPGTVWPICGPAVIFEHSPRC